MEEEIYEALAVDGQTVKGPLEKICGTMYIREQFTFGASLTRIIPGTEKVVKVYE